MTRYDMVDRAAEAAHDQMVIIDFITHSGYVLATRGDGNQLVPVTEPPSAIVDRYFDVDPDLLETESHALVEETLTVSEDDQPSY